MILELALSASLSVPVPPSQGLQLKLGDIAEPRITKTVLIVTAAVLLVQELIIVHERANGHIVPTISQVLQGWGNDYNIVPFAFGALVTHWFVNQSSISNEHTRGAMFAAVSAAILLWDIKVAAFGASGLEAGLRNPPYLALVVGAASGAIFWAQKARP